MRIIPLFGFFLCLVCSTTWAQVRFNDRGEIETTEIIIEKNKKITFPERNKIIEKATPPPRATLPEPKQYDFSDINASLPPADARIRISTIKDEQKQSNYRNYLRAGLGNYLTTYAEGKLLSPLSTKYSAGIYGKHLASALGPLKYSGTSNNQLEAFGRYFQKKYTLSANVGVERTAGYYYGYTRNFEPDNAVRDSTYQAYRLFKVQAEAISVDSAQKLSYQVRAGYYNFSDRYTLQENEAEVHTDVQYTLNSQAAIQVKSTLSLSRFADSVARNLFTIQPTYKREMNEKWQISAGLNVAAENDTTQNTPRVHVYPVIETKYKVLPKVTATIGFNGGMEKTTWRKAAQTNFFLGQSFPLAHVNKLYHFYAGVDGNITRNITFRTMPSISAFRNMYFYNHSAQDSTRFTLLYDRGTVSMFKWENDLNFEPNQTINTGVKMVYYYYVTDEVEKAWHLPTIEAQAYLKVNVNNKISASVDVWYLGGIQAKDIYTNETIRLDNIIDINIHGVYKISNRFSVYLHLFNILAQNYERYYRYPVRGISVMGGVAVSF